MKLPLKYYEYIQSSIWRKKSSACIKRDKHCCVCPETKNLQAHHWKYPDILGTEPIEWLVAICPLHHDAVTNVDRKQRYAHKLPELENYKSIISKKRKEVKKNAKIKVEDYRSVATLIAQRTNNRST